VLNAKRLPAVLVVQPDRVYPYDPLRVETEQADVGPVPVGCKAWVNLADEFPGQCEEYLHIFTCLRFRLDVSSFDAHSSSAAGIQPSFEEGEERSTTAFNTILTVYLTSAAAHSTPSTDQLVGSSSCNWSSYTDSPGAGINTSKEGWMQLLPHRIWLAIGEPQLATGLCGDQYRSVPGPSWGFHLLATRTARECQRFTRRSAPSLRYSTSAATPALHTGLTELDQKLLVCGDYPIRLRSGVPMPSAAEM
jgi:hypothetical protein